MTNDDIQAAWNSPANRPTDAETTRLTGELFQRVSHRRFWEKAWLIWSVIALAAMTALAGWGLARPGRGASAAEWAIVPLLIAPWMVILASLRARRLRAAPSAGWQIRDALVASKRANQAERKRLRSIAMLLLVSVPLLALAIVQLQEAGKVAPHELTSMAVVFAIALVGGAGAVAWRYFRVLAPEDRRLEELLRSYGATI